MSSYDFTTYVGRGTEFHLRLVDNAGDPIDISGASIAMQARTTHSRVDPVIDLSTSGGQISIADAANGQFVISVLLNSPGTFVYDVFVAGVSEVGSTRPVVEGRITAKRAVTRCECGSIEITPPPAVALEVQPPAQSIVQAAPDLYQFTSPGGYAGFEDFNDDSTSAGVSILSDAWTNVPNDGQGAFTNKNYSPGVGDLIDSSGRLVLSGLNLGDTVIIRNDIRVAPSISGAFLEWRYQLGTGASTYYLTQPLGLLGDGAREYAFQFLQLIYIGDENTRQNLCIPQVRCTEDATFRNLGAGGTVFQLGA